MENDLRQWIRLVEGIYDEPDETAGDGDSSVGSFGWWVFPDGSVDEMEEMGDHGVTADAWLSNHDPQYANKDYDEAIHMLIQAGGVRVATFHGSDSMALDLPPTLSTVVRNALLKLLRDTRSDFNQYFLGSENPKSLGFRAMVAAVRKAP
jgi:hypothetical protein